MIVELTEMEQRLRPLAFGNSSKSWKKALKLRRRHSNHPIRLGKRSGLLVFTSRRQCNRGAHRRNQSESSDLE
jgi:hypothetical protein